MDDVLYDVFYSALFNYGRFDSDSFDEYAPSSTNFIGLIQPTQNNDKILMPISGSLWWFKYVKAGLPDFIYPIRNPFHRIISARSFKSGFIKYNYESKCYRNIKVDDMIFYIKEGVIYDILGNILLSVSILMDYQAMDIHSLKDIRDFISPDNITDEYQVVRYQVRINNKFVKDKKYCSFYNAVKNSLVAYINKATNKNNIKLSDFIDIIYTTEFPEIISRIRYIKNKDLALIPEVNKEELASRLIKCSCI